ncbi:uncharacterized protein MONBRDRAFT_10903 [Monosiga brevicollis MX1]|uniref:Uncharacterized protein n=1 Tax=Monosiga brevicollis TaxID=81824 RepID=A9V7K7_MONBE|nr:uncharacterized protein MONBRDRAFT_10903 [Monosiga brevicollis MX1]EDQ86601.1 predicted protein [Monosiga brevicollis MX1]|eukprot:XP_001748714.1 hypothetical protein [Monosiga brevicollis MX1]
MALQRPAHMAAHICLGLLGFSGHPTAFRAVKETSAIPTSVHRQCHSFATNAHFFSPVPCTGVPASALVPRWFLTYPPDLGSIEWLGCIIGIRLWLEYCSFKTRQATQAGARFTVYADKFQTPFSKIDFEKRVAGQLDASDKDNSLAATRARLAAAQEESHKLKQDLERVNKEEDELQLQLRKLEAELSQLGAM